MMAAHQGVTGLVEEAAVAEVERETLMAAAIDVGVERALPLDRERRFLDAVEADLERHRLPFAEPERQRRNADRCVERAGHEDLRDGRGRSGLGHDATPAPARRREARR